MIKEIKGVVCQVTASNGAWDTATWRKQYQPSVEALRMQAERAARIDTARRVTKCRHCVDGIRTRKAQLRDGTLRTYQEPCQSCVGVERQRRISAPVLQFRPGSNGKGTRA